MDKWNLTGSFTVKDGATEDQFFLCCEAGPGPMVILRPEPHVTREEAEDLAKALRRNTSGVVLDFNYSPAAKLGFGPPSPP
jgi:hypothetical protein